MNSIVNFLDLFIISKEYDIDNLINLKEVHSHHDYLLHSHHHYHYSSRSHVLLIHVIQAILITAFSYYAPLQDQAPTY